MGEDRTTNDMFSGSKIALLCNGLVLTYQRDDFEHIPFPGMWDLPGGGREGTETPEECALRELQEEFGLALTSERIVWKNRYENETPGGLPTYFLVAQVTDEEVASIHFGSEGQAWDIVPVATFLQTLEAIPHLVERLTEYLSARE